MNNDWDSGEQLWQLLPAVYRKPPAGFPADARPPLQDYLASAGVLLDQIRETLFQLQHDSSPEASQEWLLNYLARLLDVSPLAPHLDGRRAEIGHAIRWRQRKGTWGTALETSSVVGNLGRGGPLAGETVGTDRALAIVVYEGWQRVAITPRIDQPIWPDDALGDAWRHDPKNQPIDPNVFPAVSLGASDRLHAARHPNLPSATVDFRQASRAVQSELVTIPGVDPAITADQLAVPASAVSRRTDFCGEHVNWEIAQPHGVPCAINRFPHWRERGGSYQDFSRRTVDLRTPDWRIGHHHPKRVLLFTMRPHGFFPPDHLSVAWEDRWGEDPLEENTFHDLPENPDDITRTVVSGISHITFDVDNPPKPIITRSIEQRFLPASVIPFFESITDTIEYEEGSAGFPEGGTCTEIERKSLRFLEKDVLCERPGVSDERAITYCALTDDALELDAVLNLEAPATDEVRTYSLDNVILFGELRIDSVQVSLSRCAIETVVATHGGDPAPLLDATDCLFDSIMYRPLGRLRLEYCTVFEDIACDTLQASDCILAGDVSASLGCIRFSCAPKLDLDADPYVGPDVYQHTVVDTPPLFWNNDFGLPGYGVLHPATVAEICSGAEDRGEMGGYHHRRHCHHRQAIIEKARKFLAVGLEPVVIVDPGLCDPPAKINPI